MSESDSNTYPELNEWISSGECKTPDKDYKTLVIIKVMLKRNGGSLKIHSETPSNFDKVCPNSSKCLLWIITCIHSVFYKSLAKDAKHNRKKEIKKDKEEEALWQEQRKQ